MNPVTIMSFCPCCPEVENPSGYLMEGTDEFDDHLDLDLGSPKAIKYLDNDMGYTSESISNLASNFGCSDAFKILSDSGLEKIRNSTAEMYQYAVNTPRYSATRGGTFRNRFLYGLGHSPSLLALVSRLMGCEMIYHPMRMHQLHINYKPDDDTSRQIDKWHCDSTSFVLVLFVTNPDKYEGGVLEYFNGTRDEALSFFKQGNTLPKSQVLNVGRQEAGYGVLMQGSRVFHQVTSVLSGDERTTVIFSFQPKTPLHQEPISKLAQTYNGKDPLHILIPDWARYHAWKTVQRLEVLKENNMVVDSQLNQALECCDEKMKNILRSLPYKLDSNNIKQQFEEAISAIKEWMTLFSSNTRAVGEVTKENLHEDGGNVKKRRIIFEGNQKKTSPDNDDEEFMVTKFIESEFGYKNLINAVQDVDNCIDCVCYLSKGDMEYF